MKKGEDGVTFNGKCAVSGTKKKEQKIIKTTECNVFASISSGAFIIDIPEKNIRVCLNTENVLGVLNAANARYMELRDKELGTNLVN